MAQQNNGNDLEKLYKAVSERFDIGDYDSFSSKMQTTEDRLRFYNVVSERGFDLGDYNDYESRLGKSLEVPAVGSVDTSVESVEPTSPTEVFPSAPIESSPTQNATLSEQSLVNNATDIGKQFVGGMRTYGTEVDPNNIRYEEDFRNDQAGFQRLLVDIPSSNDPVTGIERTAEFEIPKGTQVISPRLTRDGETYSLQYIDAEGNRVNALEIVTVQPSELQLKKRQLEQIPFEEWTLDDKLEYAAANIENNIGLTEEQITNERIKRNASIERNTGVIGDAVDILGGAFRAFGSGATRLGADVLGIPEFLYDAISSVAGTPTFREKYGKSFLNDVQEYMRGAISRDDLYNSVRFNNKGVVESFSDGDISDGIAKLVMGTTNSLPIMLSLSSGNAGALTSTLSMGAGQYNQLQENNPDMDLGAKMLNSTLTMYAEMIPEKIGAEATFKPFYDLFKKSGREVAETSLSKFLNTLSGQFGVITPTVVEGATEASTAIMQNLIAKYSGEDPDRQIMDGVADATLIGGFSGGVISSVPQVANSIANRQNRKKAETILSENRDIVSTLQNPDLPDEVRSALTLKYFENVQSVNGYIEQELDAKGRLNSKQRDIVSELELQRERLNATINDPNVPETIKESIQSDIDNVDAQIEDILQTTINPSDNIDPDRVDQRIQDFRDNNPNVELDDPMDSIPESVDRVMSRIDDNLPVDPVSAKETSDTLYAKYKELSDMKKDPNRTLTIAEIDGYMEQLESDIETLENYTTEGTPVQEQTQENETTETEIQPETTQEVSEVSLESSEVAPVAETTGQTQELVTEPSSSEVEATAKAPVIESPVAETDTTATPNQVKSTPASETTTQAPKTAAQATKTATQAQSSGTQLDPNTVSIPVSDITTDEASFQNRESLDTERVDNIVNNFNEVKFDPIVVYNDDGKMVVLSGHHRFAAAQRMGMKNIPSREFKGTREEAIEFARDSNTLSRPETSVERASRYRDMRSKGESESSIRDKARAAHGSEATKILNLSRLSENGKALEAIRSFQDSTDTDTRNKVEAIGDWIGNVKSRHPDLSTRQENEMFDYLMDKYGTKKKSGSVTNRSQFFDIANALVDRLKNRGDFNPESVLNFNNAAGKSGLEIEYDETLAEAKENVAKARKALDDARARAVSEGMNPDRMNKVLAPLEESLRNAIADEQAVRAQKGKLQEAVRAQTSIFDIINQNEEQIESNATIEREVQSAFDGEPTENTEASRSDQEVRQESPTGDQSEESSRSVRSGTPQLGESRRDRAGRSDSGQTKKLEGAPNVKGATGPDPALNEVARKYAQSIGIEFNRQTEYVEVDVDRAKRIAKAYEEMEHVPSDPVVKEAYENLIRQTRAQYDALSEAGYVFYFYDETNDPYNGSPWEAMRDLRGNKKMAVFATEAGYGSSATDLDVSDNPLLQDTGIEWGYGSPDGPKKKVTANDLFRAVHDAFGHGLEGAGFRARGEENAWQAHARLFTGSAIGALTTETRGQNSWLNFGPYGEQNRNAKVEDTIFADQKTGLMPEWTWKEGFDGIQYDTPSVSTSEKKDSPSSKTAKPRTPKTLLKGVADRLSKTGLAKSVTIKNSQEISEDLSRLGNVQFQTDAAELAEIEARAKADGTWMKAPNGKPTNLNEKQWVQVRSKAFKDWFGDWENDPQNASKVVDENGEPLVVYHGTEKAFTEFKSERSAQGVFWFSEDKGKIERGESGAESVSEIMPVFLNIKDTAGWNEYENKSIDEIERDGFDGVKLDDDYISFNPNQIKSATDNVGTFDGSNPDIRYQSSGSNVRGYVDAEGNIVINSDTAGLDTPIHEFAHIWERTIEKTNPLLHTQGMELIAGPDGKPYVDHVRQTQPGLEGRELYKEALAQAIGDRGARLIESQKQGPIKEWLKKAWEFIGNLVGISNLTSNEISNLTLNEYADAVATDLLQGKSLVKLPNGDISMATTAKTESELSPDEKFKLDFISKMRMKNGINYQGNVDSGSVYGDLFKDFVKFVEISRKDGSVKNKSDLRMIAKSLGITNQVQIDAAWDVTDKVESTFLRREVPDIVAENTDIERLSIDEIAERGRILYQSGVVNVVESINEYFKGDPRPLSAVEIAVFNAASIDMGKELIELKTMQETGDFDSYEYLGEKGIDAVRMRLDVIGDIRFRIDQIKIMAAYQNSRGLAMFGVKIGADFEITKWAYDLRKAGLMTPEIEAQIKDLTEKYNLATAKLDERTQELDKLKKEQGLKNIKNEAARDKPDRPVRLKTAVKKDILDAIDSVDFSSFGMGAPSFQTNGRVNFSLSSSPDVAAAVQSAVQGIKDGVNSNSDTVENLIETAVENINNAVGRGAWNEMKFRSDIINSITRKGVMVYAKKPYVSDTGRLVIPRKYIVDQVKSGVDTIEGLVDAVRKETNNSFDAFTIREAVNNYGETSGKKRSDIDTQIAQMKRVAKLTNQIEKIRDTKKRGFVNRRKTQNDSDLVKELQKERDDLLREIPMTPEEREVYNAQRNEQRQKILTQVRERLERKIKDNDFEPSSTNNDTKYEQDEQTKKLTEEVVKLQNEFKSLKYKHELESRPDWEKWGDVLFDIYQLGRMQAGADVSAVGVQAGLIAFYDPKKVGQIFAESIMKGTFSQEKYDQAFVELQAKPWYELARKAGLNMQLQSIYSQVEEQYGGGEFIGAVLKKAVKVAGIESTKVGKGVVENNPWTAANRNYDLILSHTRYWLFEELMKSQIAKNGISSENPPAHIVNEVADMVNTMTMASRIPFTPNTRTAQRIMSALFFSLPKWYSSIKLVTWLPIKTFVTNRQLFNDVYGVQFKKGSKIPQIGMVTKSLARMATLTILPTILANMYWDTLDDEEKEKEGPPMFYNPNVLTMNHSDFLKLKPNVNTRVNFFNGIDGNFIFVSRLISGQMGTSSSGMYEVPDKWKLLITYGTNKLMPTTSFLAHTAMGSERDKSMAMDRMRGANFFLPMWYASIEESLDNGNDIPLTTALGLMGLFGLNYNIYGGAEFANGKSSNPDKEVFSMFQKNDLSISTPLLGMDPTEYFNGTDLVKPGYREYNNVWKPAYEEFMLEATKSIKRYLEGNKHWEQKNGRIAGLQKEAYKHAEIEISGINWTESFKNVTYDGRRYIIPKNLYKIKAEYIKEYMDRHKGDLPLYIQDLRYDFMEDRDIKPTKRYLEMLAQNELYKEAHREANERMIEDMEAGRITLIPKDEYVSSEDNFEDE